MAYSDPTFYESQDVAPFGDYHDGYTITIATSTGTVGLTAFGMSGTNGAGKDANFQALVDALSDVPGITIDGAQKLFVASRDITPTP